MVFVQLRHPLSVSILAITVHFSVDNIIVFAVSLYPISIYMNLTIVTCTQDTVNSIIIFLCGYGNNIYRAFTCNKVTDLYFINRMKKRIYYYPYEKGRQNIFRSLLAHDVKEALCFVS